jgi:glucosamine--fructose-6-phosphate aminotransferase (isomerizing)
MRELAEDLRAKGAALYSTGHGDAAPNRLPSLPPDQPDADAVCLMQSFYAFAIRIASARGTDADRPRHLQKVTRTR